MRLHLMMLLGLLSLGLSSIQPALRALPVPSASLGGCLSDSVTSLPVLRREAWESHACLRERYGPGDWRTVSARHAWAYFDFLLQHPAEARAHVYALAYLEEQLDQWLLQGRSAPALSLARLLADARRSLYGDGWLVNAEDLDRLGEAHRLQGGLSEALRCFEQARALRHRLVTENHPVYARSLERLAATYQMTNDLTRARQLAEQAWELCYRHLPEEHLQCAAVLHTLAVLHQSARNYTAAIPLSERALALRRRLLPESHPDYLRNLNGLATLHHAAGQYRQALALYEQARALIRQYWSEEHPLYAACINNLGELYKRLGDRSRALALLREAGDLRRRTLPDAHPSNAVSLYNLARSHRDLGNFSEATRLARESLTIQQRLLDQTFSALSDRQRLALLEQGKLALHIYLSTAPAAGRPVEEVYEAVLAWKGVLTTRHAEEQADRGRPEQRRTAERLRALRMQLAQHVHTQPGSKADWAARFRELESAKEALEVELASTNLDLRPQRHSLEVGVARVRQALPADAVFVDFLEYRHQLPGRSGRGAAKAERRLLAFVLTRDRPITLIPLGSSQRIEAVIREWREQAASAAVPAASAELARLLNTPLRASLAGRRLLLTAPDGPLHGLPLAALPGQQPGSFLLEEMAVCYLTSGRQLLAPRMQRDSLGTGLLAVGDLDFGVADHEPVKRSSLWQSLPGTRWEVERIARLFREQFPQDRPPRVLVGRAADGLALRKYLEPEPEAAAWRYLHLATHAYLPASREGASGTAVPARGDGRTPREGVLMDTNPLLGSGLVLAQANRKAGSNLLTAEEVASLDLRGTELVVLSACNTGAGTPAAGEGVMGLQRAFQMAGTASLVTALWSVQDAPTCLLMEEFYANLWQKKLPRAEALRQAQLTLLRNPERILQRARELQPRADSSGAGSLLVPRGIRPEAVEPAASQATVRQSPPAWWAAFILSGDWR